MTQRILIFLLQLSLTAAVLLGQGGTIDHRNEQSTNVFAVHELEPGGCSVPEIYYNVISNKFRLCYQTNRWQDLLNATGSQTPGPNLIPQALSTGTLDPNWVVVSAASALGQSASISTTNLLVGGAMAPAGFYRLNVWAEPTSGHTGAGTVSPVTGWHSEGSAYTVTGSAISLASTSTSSFSLPITFHHDGASHISYSTTYSGPGQYQIYLILERLSLQ